MFKVISRSTFDLQVVFETLVESAAKLCEADFADIWRPNGSSYRVAATYQTTAAQKEYLATLPITPNRGSCVGRTLLEAKIVHIADIREDTEYALDLKKLGQRRTMLGVPLLRDGKPNGVIALIRTTVCPFTSRQIELVTTFADPAVVAIENTRLSPSCAGAATTSPNRWRSRRRQRRFLCVISQSKFSNCNPSSRVSYRYSGSAMHERRRAGIFRLEEGFVPLRCRLQSPPGLPGNANEKDPIAPGPGYGRRPAPPS